MTSDTQGIGMTSQRTRDRMVQRIRDQGRVTDERVLEALRRTPRHLFVDEALSSRAYEDTQLPIGHGQTISHPHTVAQMSATLLGEGSPRKVLEIGTGSGYQAAILAQLCGEVHTIERIRALAETARGNLKALNIRNVTIHLDDGLRGLKNQAPFDAILASAAPTAIPTALLEQLAPGGRLLVPVGNAEKQELLLVERGEDGFTQTLIERVNFVPMLSGRR
ncbi:MAG: protein-L-isoaspartate(D-aspartate) O-methyltransferase [Gammaproteobacteria bacterium]|nr:protein-L-isoaspartate(D-aspartate) O-methyltransferase [Gammaproteobacteria bacterium]